MSTKDCCWFLPDKQQVPFTNSNTCQNTTNFILNHSKTCPAVNFGKSKNSTFDNKKGENNGRCLL